MKLDVSTPILIVSSTEGHLSMAKTIESGLKQKGFDRVELYVEDSALLPYRLYYRFAPGLHRYTDWFMRSRAMVGLIRTVLGLAYRRKVALLVDQYQPKVVISTNYALNQNFETYERAGQLHYYTVVCDPRTYILINIAQTAGINLAFDDIQTAQILSDFPGVHCQTMGWLVRPEFQPPNSIVEAKKQIGIDQQKFAVLLVAGSEGMQRIQKTVTLLAKMGKPMTLLVACGRNKLLQVAIQELAKQHQNTPTTIMPFGYTASIAPYFQAADVVAGKAGPNMIFEAIACHKPFIATTSIEGQELGNLELIKELSIGFVETDADKAAQLIANLVDDPKLIDQMLPNIKKLATYNQKSVERLTAVIFAE